MSEDDQRLFNFDPLSLKWSTYVANFCMGTKKYLLKDDPNNLSRARRQIQRYYYMYKLNVNLPVYMYVVSRSQTTPSLPPELRRVWSAM